MHLLCNCFVGSGPEHVDYRVWLACPPLDRPVCCFLPGIIRNHFDMAAERLAMGQKQRSLCAESVRLLPQCTLRLEREGGREGGREGIGGMLHNGRPRNNVAPTRDRAQTRLSRRRGPATLIETTKQDGLFLIQVSETAGPVFRAPFSRSHVFTGSKLPYAPTHPLKDKWKV